MASLDIVITAPHLDKFVTLQVDKSEQIENVKALIEVETGILLSQQQLTYNGKEMDNNKTLSDYHVQNNDILVVNTNSNQSNTNTNNAAEEDGTPRLTWTPQRIQSYYRDRPGELQQLLHNNPKFAELVLNDDLNALGQYLEQELKKVRDAEIKRQMEISMMEADPFNPEYQKKIEEAIAMQNVNENMEKAMEYNPEVFGRVVMLYIDCEVNGVPVKAFVDSGAQTTIMSVACAERCGIMRLVDKRFAGLARGVGTAQIVGRVHAAHIKIGQSFFASSFTILAQNSGTELLIGLDMLRHHQCTIDLKGNVLRIGSEAVQFLPEKDIPMHVRLDVPMDDELPPSTTSSTSSQPSTSNVPSILPPQLNTTGSRPVHSNTQSATPKPLPTTSGPTPVNNNNANNPPINQQFLQNLLSQLPTQPQQVQSPTPAQSTQRVGASRWPEESIQKLMEFGYSRQESESALNLCNGSVEFAANYLFSQM